uniref:C2H2-type domain-containing protein n=1 Tax=Meloidogyne floridensis TaxID=298350 RepID=A0A915NLL2_9BILA
MGDHDDYYNYFEEPQSSKQKGLNEDNIVYEQLLYGEIVIREDGQICVQVQGDVKDLSFNESDSIRLIEKNGQQTLLIEKRTEHDYCKQKGLVGREGRKTTKDQLQQGDDHLHSAIQNPDGHEEVVINVDEEVVGLDGFDFTDCGEEIVVSTTPTTENINLNSTNRKQLKRVFGSNKCQECDQTFTNMAPVHQCFGAYVCPLCGKTFKYEYNLFYHWRRTCRDLNEMMTVEERKAIEINALRHLIEDISKKHPHNPLNYSKQQQSTSNNVEMDQQNYVVVQDGHDYNTSNLQSFASNLSQTQFSGENLEEVYRERITNSQDTCLTDPYTFNNQSSDRTQSNQVNKSTRALQCTECLRSFSSLQRLQKHLIDKDFYLKSPPSSKLQNEESDRPCSSTSLLTPLIENPAENGDSAMRRQMMKNIIRKYVPKSRQKLNSTKNANKNGGEIDETNNSQKIGLPRVLLQPTYRPDLPDGIHCPISVVFYGLKILVRHLKAAHPKESSVWEKTIRGLDNASNKNSKSISKAKINPKRFLTSKKSGREERNVRGEHYNFNEDTPPLLEIEQ